MKRCPACQRTYPDDQNFCLDDGTTLREEVGGSLNSADAPTSYPYRSNAAPTEVLQGMPTSAGMGGPAARPTAPPQFVQPYPQKRSNAILWFVLGGVVLIGAIITAILLVNRSPGTTTSTTSSTRPDASPSSTTSGTPNSSLNWQTVNGEGFTVSMPGEPSHNTQTTPSAVGPIPIHMYTLSEGFEGYVVGYSIYPDSVFTSAKPEELFNNVQNASISNIQGEVASQLSITINGNPGREVIGTSPSKNIGFIVRIYLVKPKLYMMIYTQYDKDKPASADGKKFLDSLQLTD